MQETGLRPNLASIKRLVQELGTMTVYSDNELKTFIYWAIGTYGHEHLSKFPLLYVRGSTGTGKTNTLKILNVLANGAEILNARSTYATARDDVDFVKTALFDEGDSLDHTLIESIFDKDTSKRKHKVKTDTDWTSVVRDLFTPTAFVGRNPLKDASNENRCIEILTRPVKDGTSKVLEVDVVAEYQEVCKEIGTTIDWTAIASNDHTREGELWIPMRAVALHLGDEEYLQFIEDDIGRLRIQKEEDWDNEPTQLVYSAALRVFLEYGGHRLLISDIQKELDGFNSKQVGKVLGDLGFKKAKIGGQSYIVNVSENLFKQIGMASNSTDEWLAG